MHASTSVMFAWLLLVTPAGAWESSRNGPLTVPPSVSEPLANILGDKPSPFFARRTVEYPYQSGARLGDGWDFATNRRSFSQCVQFGATATDTYQQATMDYSRAVDDETLSVALNINTSAHASGGFAGISASAGGSFGLDGSYKTTSKDDLIVAHASVVNGAQYIAAQKDLVEASSNHAATDPNAAPPTATPSTSPSLPGVSLAPEAMKLFGKTNSLEAFRRACGDGFVAAIGSGADLYILFHFTNLKQEDRAKITTSMNAGGGVSGIFNAGGSMSSSLDIAKLVSSDNLGIHFVQNGGKIDLIPTKLEDIATKIAGLGKEAYQHGRPLYVIVAPYTELANWPPVSSFPTIADVRTGLIRYQQRIQSAYSEIKSVVADLQQPRSTIPGYYYIHDVFHHLRSEDYTDIQEDLSKEMNDIAKRLQAVNAACIDSKPEGRASGPCKTALTTASANLNLDDFRFWRRMPIPTNSLTPGLASVIVDPTVDIEQRKYVLSIGLYHHWIQRLDNERCAVFGECIDKAKRKLEYQAISTSLGIEY